MRHAIIAVLGSVLMAGCWQPPPPKPREKPKNLFLGTWESTKGSGSLNVVLAPVEIANDIQNYTLRMELGRLGKGNLIFISRGIVYDDITLVAEIRWWTEKLGGKTRLFIDKVGGDVRGEEVLQIDIVSELTLIGTNELGHRMVFNRIGDAEQAPK